MTFAASLQDPYCKPTPTFQNHLACIVAYRPPSVRQQLILRMAGTSTSSYHPCGTIASKLNLLGFRAASGSSSSRPQKK